MQNTVLVPTLASTTAVRKWLSGQFFLTRLPRSKERFLSRGLSSCRIKETTVNARYRGPSWGTHECAPCESRPAIDDPTVRSTFLRSEEENEGWCPATNCACRCRVTFYTSDTASRSPRARQVKVSLKLFFCNINTNAETADLLNARVQSIGKTRTHHASQYYRRYFLSTFRERCRWFLP